MLADRALSWAQNGTKWSLSYVIHIIHWILSTCPFYHSLPAPFGPLLCLFFLLNFSFYDFLNCLFYFTFCLAFPRLQGPSQSKKKTAMHSILFTLSTIVLSPSCSYHLIPLVSPPARRVCGLRLCAAHDQTTTRNFPSSDSSVFFFASGSLFSWTIVLGYLCSYFVAFHCVGML